MQPRFTSRHGVRMRCLSGLVLTACLFAGSALADDWFKPQFDYGNYTQADGKRAQPMLSRAISVPMDTLAAEAADVHADAMITYGAALSLGREPGQLDGGRQARAHTMFKALMASWVTGGDRITLTGDEPDLLNMPEFWFLVGRSLTVSQPRVLRLGNSEKGGALAPDPSATSGSYLDSDVFLGPDGKRHSFKGDYPELDKRLVTATRACSVMAMTAARMQRVTELDLHAQPRLTPEEMRGFQVQARGLLHQIRLHVDEACGDRDMFDKAVSVASQHLGVLGDLKVASGDAGGKDSPKP